jgi:quercetin dioxygenase-like cupin family protein
MMPRLLCGALVLCLLLNLAEAQDATKVAPKHYKVHFENEWVEVVDIHYGAHERSALHEHPAGVVVNLTAGHLRFTDQNGKVQEVYSLAGESRWFPPVKHTVENIGDEPFNAVYISIKGKPTTSAGDPKGKAPMSAELLTKILADYAQTRAKP